MAQRVKDTKQYSTPAGPVNPNTARLIGAALAMPKIKGKKQVKKAAVKKKPAAGKWIPASDELKTALGVKESANRPGYSPPPKPKPRGTRTDDTPLGFLPKESLLRALLDPSERRAFTQSMSDPGKYSIRRRPAGEVLAKTKGMSVEDNYIFDSGGLVVGRVGKGALKGLMKRGLKSKGAKTTTPGKTQASAAGPEILGKSTPQSSPIQAAQTSGLDDIPGALLPGAKGTPKTPKGQSKKGTATSAKELTPQPSDLPGADMRSFTQQVLDNPNIPELQKAKLQGLYTARNTQDASIKAKNLVNEEPDLAHYIAKNLDVNDDRGAFISQELIKKLQSEGNYETAIDLANDLAVKMTQAGRFGQAASIYSKLTPDGILRFAMREVNKYNQISGKRIKMTPEKAQKLQDMAAKLDGMAEGYEKQVATSKMLKEIHSMFPASWARKIATLQTMAQLLNPKTMIRNIGGNTMFMGVENISQTVATPLDKALSLITGKRTTALPSARTQVKSGLEGLVQGAKEAWAGINTGATTQFELNDIPAFRGAILGTLERTMGVSLRGPDRAAFKAAFDDSIRGSLKANKTNIATSEMIEQATHAGLYRTFQDENVVSNFFVGMKRTLNRVGITGADGGRFGLGDLILKYPKTPGNLLARGIDYSPLGFTKTVFEATKPLLTGKPFNQKEFVDSFSRALVGSSGLVGTGIVLGSLGIITESPNKDKDVRGLQKTVGQGAYQINVSALKRFVLSGLNKDAAKLRKGDTLVSYDWAQPMAIPVSMGAAIANKSSSGETAGATVDALTGGVETLAEQPLVSGVQRFFGGYDPVQSFVVDPLKSMPASFVPTLSNQIRQLSNNTSRNSYEPDAKEHALNMVKGKIPGLAGTLPERRTIFGDVQEQYQDGSNTPFNVFLNPSFVSKYKPTPEASEVIRLEKATGEAGHIPRVAAKTIKKNGETIELTGKEIARYQEIIGKKSKVLLKYLIVSPEYRALSEEEKSGAIQAQLTKINASAKAEILAGRATQSDIKASFKKYVSEYQSGGGSTKTLKKRLKSLHPLDGMEEAEAVAYIEGLDKKDVQRLSEAYQYYKTEIEPLTQ